MLRLRPLASIWSNQRHFLDRLICNKYFLSAVFLPQLVRRPLPGVDGVLAGGIVDAAQGGVRPRPLDKAADPAGQVGGVFPDDAGAWQTEGACAIIEP